LRASLARLWVAHGVRRKAHDLLAGAYGWFADGVDAPDLWNAKARFGSNPVEEQS
jgi:hypothetical protein